MNDLRDKALQISEDLKKLSQDAVNKSGLPVIGDEKTKDPILIDQNTLLIKFLLPVKRIMPFFEGLRRGEVIATRCRRCGAKYFPPQPDCSRCYESDMEWFRISNEGVLMAYTQIKVKPASFSSYDDYIVGVAKFPDDLKIVAKVLSNDLESLKVGMRVKLVVVKQEQGGNLLYAFEPQY